MSFFAIKVESIEKVWAHPNADRLDVATVRGMDFQFCVGRGQYKPGDTVVYFPVDSVLPDALIEQLAIRNMMAGADKNRVKTVQLRGQVSQGLVVRADTLFPAGSPPVGTDITQTLGVTKYEQPEPKTSGGTLVPLPEGLGVYDIEGADRFPNVADWLMEQRCYITEKVEGSNAALVRSPTGELTVCQRNYAIHLDEGAASNSFVTAFKAPRFLHLIESVAAVYPDKTVALRGELLGPGVQGNIYRMSKHEIRLFDIKVDGRYLDAAEFLGFVGDNTDLVVPLLGFDIPLREWLSGKTVGDASDGYSLLDPKVRREGIVIKPMYEDRVDFGNGRGSRLIIKQRSPLYLANEK
jgi:RNA ligase (TIGR02306 family)